MPSWSLQIADAPLHCFPIFSRVFDECRKYDQLLTCYVETHTDDPQWFPLHMGLTLTEGSVNTLHKSNYIIIIIIIIIIMTFVLNGRYSLTELRVTCSIDSRRSRIPSHVVASRFVETSHEISKFIINLRTVLYVPSCNGSFNYCYQLPAWPLYHHFTCTLATSRTLNCQCVLLQLRTFEW
jgi:hypothetical protein